MIFIKLINKIQNHIQKHQNYTPWKINMEPANHPFRKEMIFQTSMIMFHVNLPGCANSTFTFWSRSYRYPIIYKYLIQL